MNLKEKLFGDSNNIKKIKYLMYSLMAIPLLPALFLAEDFVANSVFCQSFITFMSYLVPGIEEFARISDYANILGLQLSMVWATAPILFIVSLKHYKNNTDDVKISSDREMYIFIFLGLIVAIGFYLGWFSDNRSSRRMVDYRLGIEMITLLHMFGILLNTKMISYHKNRKDKR